MIEISKVENGFILSRDDVPEHAFVFNTLEKLITYLLRLYHEDDSYRGEYKITFERKDGIWREM